MTVTAKVIRSNPFVPSVPTLKQLQFLARPEREVFFGGAAGPGKSEALLMAALMYVDLSDYAAILFRRTHTDLALEGALMDRAHDWLSGTAAKWKAQEKKWEFPSGATLTFGYMDGPQDWRRYDSTEFQFIGLDEATQFRPHDINAVSGRLRRKIGSPIPTRLRLASNPGGEAHDYLGERYVEPKELNPERVFIPALLDDNPYVDREEYEQTLEGLKDLDPILYRQRRFGEWIEDEGESIFLREWWRNQNRFDPTDPVLTRLSIGRFAAFDTANKLDTDNAYTVCVVGELDRDYRLRIIDVQRERVSFPDLPEWTTAILRKHMRDLKLKGVWIEEAASGVQLLQVLGRTAPQWLRNILWASKPIKSKEDRWKAAALWAKRGGVLLPHPDNSVPWLYEFEQEVFKVPNATFLDQADAFSMLINELEISQGVFSDGWAARTSIGAA